MTKSYGIPCIDRAEKPETRGARYGFVSTAAILENLEQKGWCIEKIQTSKSRDPSTAKHLVRLSHPSFSGALGAGLRPTFNVLNSHDGKSRLRIGMGVYRMVCSNGLMVGAEWGAVDVIHRDTLVTDVETKINEIAALVPAVSRQIQEMKSKQLNRSEIEALYTKIVSLRLNDQDKLVTQQAFRPIRIEDAYNDVFTVFNRAQESLMRGGFGYETLDETGRAVLKNAKSIRNVGLQVSLNRQAWNIAMEAV